MVVTESFLYHDSSRFYPHADPYMSANLAFPECSSGLHQRATPGYVFGPDEYGQLRKNNE